MSQQVNKIILSFQPPISRSKSSIKYDPNKVSSPNNNQKGNKIKAECQIQQAKSLPKTLKNYKDTYLNTIKYVDVMRNAESRSNKNTKCYVLDEKAEAQNEETFNKLFTFERHAVNTQINKTIKNRLAVKVKQAEQGLQYLKQRYELRLKQKQQILNFYQRLILKQQSNYQNDQQSKFIV